MANINTALQWMHNKRAAGMRYSMDFRHSENYSDCSSAVLRALQHAGFNVPWIGNTDAMFGWVGTLFTPINRSQIQAGDVFISGNPGSSGNAYGHTGFALNATQAIHSSSRFNGIGISGNSDAEVRAYWGAPVYWYRVIGVGSNPDPGGDTGNEEDNRIFLEDEFVDHDYLQSVFGIKVATWTIDDVESQTDLKQKAMDQLNAQLDEYHETTLTVLELGIKNEELELIELGNTYLTNTNGRLMTNGSRRVIRQNINLLEPQKSQITFGTKYKVLVDYLAERN